MKPTKEQMSADDLAKLKKEVIAEYKQEIPLLTLQRDYEVLLADIEEAKLRRQVALIRHASLYAENESNKQSKKK